MWEHLVSHLRARPHPTGRVRGDVGTTTGVPSAWEPSSNEFQALFAELGRCLYLYQLIEQHLKEVLPFLAVSDDQEPGGTELAADWRALLDSKKTMGALVQLLSERTSSGDKESWEMAWRTMVEERNQIVHHFASQPFGKIATSADYQQALSYLQARRLSAAPFLEILEQIHQAVTQTIDDLARGRGSAQA